MRSSCMHALSSITVDTMRYFEELIAEHIKVGDKSRLKQFVPSVGRIFTELSLSEAFLYYDAKYSISKRRYISPSFNEIRHILNLSQVMAIAEGLKLITFDGDQTLYSDGGNFEHDEELSVGIMSLLCRGIKVAVVTAAGYGLDGSKYARRLRGLLDRFVAEKLTRAEVECFYVFGGECNYLMQCTMRDYLLQRGGVSGIAADDGELASSVVMFQPVPVEEWQSDRLSGPKPMHWPMEEVTQVLDIAEQSMKATVKELNLRAKVLLLLLLLLAVSAASLLY